MAVKTHPKHSAVVLLALAAVLPACGDSDKGTVRIGSDNADGKGGSGSGTIIVRGAGQPEGDGSRLLTFRGSDDQNQPLTVHLAVRADLAVLERPNRIELRTPALPATVVVPGGQLLLEPSGPEFARIDVPAGVTPLPGLTGPGAFYCLAAGNLVVFQSLTRVFLFQEGDQPERIDPLRSRWTWSLTGDMLRLDTDKGTRLVAAPRMTSADQHLDYVAETNTIKIAGPRGELSAELPKERVTISPALSGIRLLGELRDRAGRPLFVFQPLQNRHLLVVAQR